MNGQEGEEEDFASLDLQGFKLFYNELHEKYLKDTTIDYDTERFGGQLTIKAPNTKTPIIDENSTIEERINAVIINEINPSINKVRKILGWKPKISFDEGLERTIDWYRKYLDVIYNPSSNLNIW